MHFTTLYDTLHYVSLLSDHTPIPTVQTLWNKIHRSTQSSVQYLNWILQIFARSEPGQMIKSYFPSSFWVLVGEELIEGWRWCIPRRVWVCWRGTGYKCISAAHTYLSSAGSVSERYQAWLCISRGCISGPSTAIAPGRDQTPSLRVHLEQVYFDNVMERRLKRRQAGWGGGGLKRLTTLNKYCSPGQLFLSLNLPHENYTALCAPPYFVLYTLGRHRFHRVQYTLYIHTLHCKQTLQSTSRCTNSTNSTSPATLVDQL